MTPKNPRLAAIAEGIFDRHAEAFRQLGEETFLDVKKLHRLSAHHRAALEASPTCGCFGCLRIFSPTEITEWVARDANDTAVCPHCGSDTVIPGGDVHLTPELLTAMRNEWQPGSMPFYDEVAAGYAARTPEERAEDAAELAEWDSTLQDGLEDD